MTLKLILAADVNYIDAIGGLVSSVCFTAFISDTCIEYRTYSLVYQSVRAINKECNETPNLRAECRGLKIRPFVLTLPHPPYQLLNATGDVGGSLGTSGGQPTPLEQFWANVSDSVSLTGRFVLVGTVGVNVSGISGTPTQAQVCTIHHANEIMRD